MDNECFGCGCTDTKACVNNNKPCHWLVLDKTLGLGVCSNCPEQVKVFEQHQKDMANLALSE